MMEEKLSKLEEEIKNLNPDEQKQKLNEFMQTLNPEELNQIKQSQCVFCLIAQNKAQAKKVYEDDKFLGILDIRPANPGHVILFPKNHINFLSNLNEKDISDIFNIANKIGINLVEKLKAEGVNILVSSGLAAGQKLDHIAIHIIPRFKDDKISFEWQPKEINEEDLERIKNLIKVEEVKEEVKKIKKEKIDVENRIP